MLHPLPPNGTWVTWRPLPLGAKRLSNSLNNHHTTPHHTYTQHATHDMQHRNHSSTTTEFQSDVCKHTHRKLTTQGREQQAPGSWNLCTHRNRLSCSLYCRFPFFVHLQQPNRKERGRQAHILTEQREVLGEVFVFLFTLR